MHDLHGLLERLITERDGRPGDWWTTPRAPAPALLGIPGDLDEIVRAAREIGGWEFVMDESGAYVGPLSG